MSSATTADVAATKHARPPLLRRLYLSGFIWFLKTLVYIYINLRKRSILPSKSAGPTYKKIYPVRPQIECRVFIPKTYTPGEKLPLLIDIHGGGFCIGHPLIDDRDNDFFCHKHGFVVVSIGYRLAPTYQFPTAPHDVGVLIKAVVEDEDLPVDHSKIAVCGYSAGGNLTLAGVQQHGLHDIVKAAISFYGVVDFVATVTEKLETRVSDGKEDLLKNQAPAFNYSYVPQGQDRRDPLLSPMYAPRNVLPKHIFLLGCEYDMLCKESEIMADKLAELETGQKIMYPDGSGWRKGNLRWELIKGQTHGFNQTPSTGEEAARRRARSEKMYADVAKWLKEEVFK